MPAMARPPREEWTASQMGAGVILYLVAQVLRLNDALASAAASLTWCFAAYLILCLFSYNRGLLAEGSASASGSLLTANRKLLAVLCAAALLFSNLQAVGTALRAAFRWIASTAVRLWVWLASLFRPESVVDTTSQGGNPLEGFAEGAEPGAIARILEIILYGIAALIAAALLFFAFRYVLGLLRKAFRRLLERWQSYRRLISADYVDQAESLLDWGELRKTARARMDRFRRRYLPVPWETLNPAQRVRRVYALLLRRPGAKDPALTARETLLGGTLRLPAEDAAALAALYDQARYSDHPVASEDADALRRRVGV